MPKVLSQEAVEHFHEQGFLSPVPVLSAEEARPLGIDGMQPVGNYAYTIHFSDGHDTGIFTFSLLRQLGAVDS